MLLTSLEIYGFKSFANREKFVFDKGITGIVGPNGCGKSNVVDAIRWVLGEQKTRNLRSDKMENVIFNGTQKRRKSNFAEVSLSFENTKNILPTEMKMTLSLSPVSNAINESFCEAIQTLFEASRSARMAIRWQVVGMTDDCVFGIQKQSR